MKSATLIATLLIFQSVFSQQDAWIYLTDKPNSDIALANPLTILSQKSIDRKTLHGVAIDERDVPVEVSYISQINAVTGITVMTKSKWINALHVRGSETDINSLLSFNFVSSIDFADKGLNNKLTHQQENNKFNETFTTFNYGNAANQIEMIKGNELHLLDYTGNGMTIAVLDAGFIHVNTMGAFQRLRDAGNVISAYDFVDDLNNVYINQTSTHGTMVLSTMAGYVEDEFVGTAPDATYYLFRTEDAPNENPVEESYWVAAAEMADSIGIDIINTSLGYSTYDNPNYNYTTDDMDGNTAFISRGANIAFEKGILLVNSAGNSGATSWGIVTAPGDAPGVLTVGAVDASRSYAPFSSIGTANQPTQKPDVMAQGSASFVINQNNTIRTANGTSFSSPIMAGGIACLWQALPSKTNAEIMQLVRESASIYNSPTYFLGYGIPDLQLALSLSTPDEGFDSLIVFPNPATDFFSIGSSEQDETVSISLFDLLGKHIYSSSQLYENNQFDISLLSTGIYIATIKNGEQQTIVKIIKQ
ncbi:MAG: S8 family serine peptidase [Urechidicola sp.]|nr:S8 family serine peptidase [Urechidicola sp.]